MDPGTLILGALGLGLGLFSSNQQAKQQREMYNQQMSALKSINTQPSAEMPTVPTAPSADPEAPQNDEAEEARKEALRQSAANNQMVNPTGGLGVTGMPNMKKRTLGGA